MSDEKKGNEAEQINVKVLGQDNTVVQFKIKKHTPLRKLMNVYCDRAGLSMGVVRFRFDGNPINETDTPTSLEMEEGDTIEVYQQQTGGTYC
ncbi:small ubiquitin-related modifier 2 [Agrilus planipennis]|uniref:Small ubiquitin-related modifier n=1 Tax=Agrilus planipennis TaxID=224129 RepID=A0A1W4XH81_AGRPL|nr:small ubiquitin-related modifier 2 [Agrilus planipennis]